MCHNGNNAADKVCTFQANVLTEQMVVLAKLGCCTQLTRIRSSCSGKSCQSTLCIKAVGHLHSGRGHIFDMMHTALSVYRLLISHETHNAAGLQVADVPSITQCCCFAGYWSAEPGGELAAHSPDTAGTPDEGLNPPRTHTAANSCIKGSW